MILNWKMLGGVYIAPTTVWRESWLMYVITPEEQDGVIVYSLKGSHSQLIGDAGDYLCEPEFDTLEGAQKAVEHLEMMWSKEADNDPPLTHGDELDFVIDDRIRFLQDPTYTPTSN